MRSSIILTSLLATLALANPVDRRALTTKVEVHTVWTTVTEGAIPTPYSDGKGGEGSRGGRHRSSAEAVPSPETPTPTPEVVPSPSAPEPTAISSEVEEEEEEEESAPEPTAISSEEEEEEEEEESVPAPTPSAPAAEPPALATGNLDSYAQKILLQHNIHRANHTETGPLTWSDKLTATALKIANSCVYEHDTATDKDQYESGYGQNIGAGAPPEDIPAMITNGMYNDEAPYYEGLYGQDNPSMSNFKAWGHFTQIVWKNTKEVGCATVKCDSLANSGGSVRPYFTVCNYSPPGNYGGQYGANVGTRLGKATVTV